MAVESRASRGLLPKIMAEAGFHDSYTIGSQLGSGAFSVVNEATPVGGGPKVAVKCIR